MQVEGGRGRRGEGPLIEVVFFTTVALQWYHSVARSGTTDMLGTQFGTSMRSISCIGHTWVIRKSPRENHWFHRP